MRSANRLTRRRFLVAGGSVLLAGCAEADDDGPPDSSAPGTGGSTPSVSTPESTGSTPAPTGSTPTPDDPATPTGPGPLSPAMFDALGVCALTRTDAEGPFPSLERLDRRDVTEGLSGHPLRLGLRIVNADCAPIPGAEAEIWHTDLTGDYSSYEDGGDGKDEGAGTTFLRGIQRADDAGIVEFQSIYPGWYGGRAVHIHAKVRVDGAEVLTTQLYFDESYTESVLATGDYAEFGPPDTGWADDGLIGDPTTDGTGLSLAPGATSLGEGTLGLANLGVSV